MTRIGLAVFSLGFLSTPLVFAQRTVASTDDLAAEVKLLKRIVAEQDRRITTLEQLLKQNETTLTTERSSEAPHAATAAASAWKTNSAWKRLKEGMSRAQVVAILGMPTSVKSVGDRTYETLFYRGDVPGAGSVTGTVELNNDRVWQINIPVF